MTVQQTTRFGLYTWSVDEDPISRVQFTLSHEAIEALAGKFTTGTSNPALPDAAYVRALFYNTTDSTLYFSPTGLSGSWTAIGTGTDFVRTNATQTLTAKTLTNPIISTISNTGTLTLPTATTTLVGTDTTDTLSNKTLTDPVVNDAVIKTPEEVWTIVGAAPTATTNIDTGSSGAHLYTSNTTTNFTLNFRYNSGATLDGRLSTGHSVTVAVAVTNGGTAYYPTTIQVDGTTRTVKWQGGNAPAGGNANSIDVYAFTIVKTAANTFTVLGSQTKFA